jgi:hypothetical protein
MREILLKYVTAGVWAWVLAAALLYVAARYALTA